VPPTETETSVVCHGRLRSFKNLCTNFLGHVAVSFSDAFFFFEKVFKRGPEKVYFGCGVAESGENEEVHNDIRRFCQR
jgi:hypothetical protein